ncbi:MULTISPECIES: hypothetical protein [Actinosynnema]|uniref:Terminase small subunit n=1 Tax=Actinosynnema pretiosum TaxID=42197 RepID=A0A290ZAY3_9PSEU|nr:hypothetical protein [Actinosynnema pretiosum]ATE56156.1 hypothetical protein CNX65_25140 [Actinosynnema pretiosum]MCP2098606.1 hypothetical protein [Actinosynnema pretiosum]
MADDVDTPQPPAGLDQAGAALWRDLHELTAFDPAQTILVREACRIVDRLDELDRQLSGAGARMVHVREDREDDTTFHLVVDGALSEARQQQNVLKQLLVTLRLPDTKTGKRPQLRGARGAYQPSGTVAVGGTVSPLERARRRSAGA